MVKKGVLFPTVLLGIAAFIALRLLAPPPTPYDYFYRLAQTLTTGRLYLTEAPPWLNELIPAGPKRFYVPYPPMPAIILTPFVFLGIPIDQMFLANILGATNVSLSFIVALLVSKSMPSRLTVKEHALLMALFVGFNMPHFFLASVGSAWYLAHVVATTFLLLATIAALNRFALWTGLFLGAAYWSRLPTLLATPLLLYLLVNQRGKNEPRKQLVFLLLRFFLGIGVFVTLNSLYNYTRFGVPWDVGYTLIPGVLSEPWYQKGIFHPSYIRRHLNVLLFGLPKRAIDFPYLMPSWAGMAIWLTTPVLLLILLAFPSSKLALVSWLSLLLTSLPSLLHGTTGFAQFGYRFVMDSILPLFFLVYLGISKVSRYLTWLLILVGVVINFWGVFTINRLGLVGW